ncbi:DUF4286 family protein [Pseudomonas mangiferae]|uniref:DUF4286 domain-containing protein n=1 Tax=Pseudomonas mangiferae TaxID=2593654 RepID=A0A553GTP3_9PSED|nr:DUF4286 family protein [Pseudomonas mangiferae]TRX72831.1 hypothetical protein FM069_20860 [Pseudomonas mangiferae]
MTVPALHDDAFLHLVRVDIDPAHEAAFNRWYQEEHFPDLAACPGWTPLQRFVCLGEGPRYAALYKVEGPWAFETPQFLKVKGFGRFEPFVKNFTRLQLKHLP